MSLANTDDLHAGEVGLDAADLRPGDRLVWTQTDGARVLVRVTRINRDAGIAYLRCHWAGRSWTRRQDLPLFPSMKRADWTTDELLETVE